MMSLPPRVGKQKPLVDEEKRTLGICSDIGAAQSGVRHESRALSQKATA